MASMMSLLFFGALAMLLFITVWFVRKLKEEYPDVDEFDTAEWLLWVAGCITVVTGGVQAFSAFRRRDARKIITYGVVGGAAAVAGLAVWLGIKFGQVDTADDILNQTARYLMAQMYVVAAFAGVAAIMILTESMGPSKPKP